MLFLGCFEAIGEDLAVASRGNSETNCLVKGSSIEVLKDRIEDVGVGAGAGW